MFPSSSESSNSINSLKSFPQSMSVYSKLTSVATEITFTLGPWPMG